ncbi:Syntaxin-binding protein 1 [Tyrophagus putrescentiae]|nr:Syntaxin-binding protein 1 [Tyrophagus putrescentiae]
MTLKRLVKEKILNDVIGACSKGKWKVLVVDRLGVRIISACCDLNEVIARGVALVEDISKKREPLQTLEAIYLISPEKSIKHLIADFADEPLYQGAHVFFTSTCPVELLKELGQSKAARYIHTLVEINTAFVPYETQVFSLDCTADMFSALFSSTKSALEECADHLATVCATLGELPKIGFRNDDQGLNIRFATLVQQRLEQYKAIDGKELREGHSQLLIIDRGFDCVTPVIHDLTFQSMVYDLMKVENDVWTYRPEGGKSGEERQLLFSENAELWEDFRHKHIAVVNQQLPARVKAFKEENKVMEQAGTGTGERADMKALGEIVKKLPRYQKENAKYYSFFKVTEDCMRRYTTYVNKMCLVEQDIAMGSDVTGERLTEATIPKRVFPLFLDPNLETQDKVRIILLYILSNNGITEENLEKLLTHAAIPEADRRIITNLSKLGIDMDPTKQRRTGQNSQAYPRRNRITDQTYDTARWTPVVKDVIEDAIADRLSPAHFTYLSANAENGAKPGMLSKAAPKSLRFGGDQVKTTGSALPNGNGGQSSVKNSRLIVFLLGGVTFSEMRCAYEVSRAANSSCEVIIGSDQIMTPASFLENMRQLN